jgi:hypothetical protein
LEEERKRIALEAEQKRKAEIKRIQEETANMVGQIELNDQK